jgi:hypothetical protein
MTRLVDILLSSGATSRTVEKVTPESGAPGVSIAITGSGLQTVSIVRFGPAVVPVVATSDHFVQVGALREMRRRRRSDAAMEYGARPPPRRSPTLGA